MTNKEKAKHTLESIETGDVSGLNFIHPEHYKQHNLMIEDGLGGIKKVIAQAPPRSLKAKVVRIFEDGDHVFAHTEYDFFGPKVGFDVFRFEHGMIVEHWDNLIEQQPVNGSGRGQTDGATQLLDHTARIANKELVRKFVTENWMEQRDTYDQYIAENRYIQHNPMGSDGLDTFRQTLAYFEQAGISMYFTKLHKVLGEGNFVLTMGEGFFGPGEGVPTSFYDLFRVEDGKIVEHWDVIEPIVPEQQRMNANGKF